MEDYFNTCFYYDETSPSKLRWKINRIGGHSPGHIISPANRIAGCLNKAGYWAVGCGNKVYLVHRIILTMQGMDCTSKQVDHINQDKSDNTISNLRLVNNSINQKNRSKQSNNKTGITGVLLQKVKYKPNLVYEYFVANWTDIDGNNKRKAFSINNLGRELAFDLACDYRKQMVVLLNSLGGGYTSLHGT